jgi:competence protein ComEA
LELGKLCKGCHEVERSVSRRQDRDAWHATLNKMTALGMKGADAELGAVLEYLVKNYPPEDVPRVNVNKATSIELESGLTLRRSQAAALIAYREKNGDFKTLEDLKKVPNLDAVTINAKKDRITF